MNMNKESDIFIFADELEIEDVQEEISAKFMVITMKL